MAAEAQLDPQDQMESEGKWALKDRRGRKEPKEMLESGVRKVTEVSQDSTVCQARLVKPENQEPKVSTDHPGRGVLLAWWVHLEMKETSVNLDPRALLGAEGPWVTWENRVHKVNLDHQALQAHLDLPLQQWKTSTSPPTTTKETAAFQTPWTLWRTTWRLISLLHLQR